MSWLTRISLLLCFVATPGAAVSNEQHVGIIEAALNDCASFVTAANYRFLNSSWNEIKSNQHRAIDERVFAHNELPLVLEALVMTLDEKTIREKKLPVSPFAAADCKLKNVDAGETTIRYRLRSLELPDSWRGFESIRSDQLQEATSSWFQSRSSSLSRLSPESEKREVGYVDCSLANPEFIMISSEGTDKPADFSNWGVDIRTLLPGQADKFCDRVGR